jgi:hypothetical protein
VTQTFKLIELEVAIKDKNELFSIEPQNTLYN